MTLINSDLESQMEGFVRPSQGWSDGPFLGFDLETTGVNPLEDAPVSVALVLRSSGQTICEEYFLINPGRPIPAGAFAIHSISDAMVEANGVELAGALNKIFGIISKASEVGIPVVGMNVSYDLTIVQSQLHEVGGKSLLNTPVRVIDVLTLDRHFDRYRKGNRKLGTLCDHYGVDLIDAHNALGDAQASLQILERQIERFPELSTLSLDQLHTGQVEWHRQWAEDFSKWLERQGKPPLSSREKNWPYCTD